MKYRSHRALAETAFLRGPGAVEYLINLINKKAMMTLDVQNRSDFPILHTRVYGKPLVYLDNAATTQKPQVVIDAIVDYYTRYNSNIHRAAHHLSNLATEAHEGARRTMQRHINAEFEHEIIFTAAQRKPLTWWRILLEKRS